MTERKHKPASAALNFRMPAKQYDQIYTKASQAGLTVPEWIRQMLRHTLQQNPHKPK